MKISNLIFVKYDYEIMKIVNSDDEDPLNWSLLSIDENIIPNEGHVLVRSQQILENEERTCWMNISLPEMISDFVFTIDAKNSKIMLNNYYEMADSVVPNKLSNSFCSYEFYYTKAKPEVGIEILKKEIENVIDKGLVCEYLGYIYRDEEENGKSIEWFLKGLDFGEPSSEFIYKEISDLYHKIGELKLAEKYLRKFE